ncbi:MAG TPA: 50S ribosomal protein L10, partial [Patescibacteria group bacterium]|nr:50S ribosomal protein L10 [Patescibacteria group bacterium]
GEMPALDGQIGLAWGADQIAPARGVYEFQKKLDKKVELLGGIFEGRFMNREEMSGIASIPPRQTLYGQLVNVINSPIQGLVIALSKINR